MKAAVLLFLLLALFSTDGQAQQPNPSVGHIQQIAIQRGELVTTTEDAQLLRIGGSEPARTAAPLYRRDLLRLYEPLFIDLLFSQSSLSSRAVLGPSLHAGSVSLGNVGTYEILENTVDPLSRFQVIVRHGAMVIEHVSGRLDVIASGTRTRIFGTTVLFDVGADTTEGFLLSAGRPFCWKATSASRTTTSMLPGRIEPGAYAPTCRRRSLYWARKPRDGTARGSKTTPPRCGKTRYHSGRNLPSSCRLPSPSSEAPSTCSRGAGMDIRLPSEAERSPSTFPIRTCPIKTYQHLVEAAYEPDEIPVLCSVAVRPRTRRL